MHSTTLSSVNLQQTVLQEMLLSPPQAVSPALPVVGQIFPRRSYKLKTGWMCSFIRAS